MPVSDGGPVFPGVRVNPGTGSVDRSERLHGGGLTRLDLYYCFALQVVLDPTRLPIGNPPPVGAFQGACQTAMNLAKEMLIVYDAQ